MTFDQNEFISFLLKQAMERKEHYAINLAYENYQNFQEWKIVITESKEGNQAFTAFAFISKIVELTNIIFENEVKCGIKNTCIEEIIQYELI